MVELQDIVIEYGKEFKEKYKLIPHIHKALRAIENCRTAALGAHEDICNNAECGHIKISYNSCRNRHCPKCQNSSKEKWLYERKFDVLNVQYFHVVFTIPEELNIIGLQNQKEIYNILFKSVSETLQELGRDKKYLGAEIGFMTVLHTWGQNIMYHPHIHCVVPAGGLDKLGKWRNSKKKFFIPVKVLSRKFRGKFLYYLKNSNIEFYGQNKELENPQNFDRLMSELYQKEWITYCKPPFKNTNGVIEYLGRYTHRVAISNNRIVSTDDGKVSFKYKDYKDNSNWKIMTLEAQEFIRRFILHILPPGFMKIRYYGLLGNRNKSMKLEICKKLTNTKIVKKIKLPALDILKQILGKDFNLCPICKKGYLIRPAPNINITI